MEPFKVIHDEMTYIDVGQEIEEIKKRLIEMGEYGKQTTESMKTFTDSSDRPIAARKVKAAKRRKQKRKNGGPR